MKTHHDNLLDYFHNMCWNIPWCILYALIKEPIHLSIPLFDGIRLSDLTEIGIDVRTGRVKLDDLENAVCDRTCLVSLMMANNETGVIQPVAKVAEIVRSDFLKQSSDKKTNKSLKYPNIVWNIF